MSVFRLAGRTILVAVCVVVLVITAVGPALADSPEWGDGHRDSDTSVRPGSAEQASLDGKLALAEMYEQYAATGTWAPGSTDAISPMYVCEFDPCEPPPPPPSPPTSKTLDTRTRRQSTDYYCGPASGQVVINWSRGIFYDNLNGENTSTNWRTQTTIAGWMGTTPSAGTSGYQIKNALNQDNAVLKPDPDWAYHYTVSDNGAQFHSKIVADIAGSSMPVVPDVKPHKNDAVYWLPSWPNEATGAKHWITIRGYDGFWNGTNDPKVFYNDSSGQTGPDKYTTGALTMWKVTEYLYSKVVW